ncbi:MAG TPA: hypothetical protein V6C65_27095, partial [Allocoleopsis sp.]
QSVPQISSVPGKVTTTVKETASKAKLTKTVKDTSATYRSDAERLSEDDFVVGEVDFPEDFVAAREAAKYDVDYATDGERLINGWDVGEVDFPDEFRAVQAAVDIGRELAKEEQNLVSTLAKTGSQREAVDLNIAREAEHIPGDVRDPSEFKNLSAQLSSMYNPRNWIGDGRRLTREATERVLNVLDATRANLAKGITEPGQAVRLTGNALAKAIELAKKRIREEFRFANDGIIDTRWVVHTQSDNPETQLNTLEVTIGNVNGFGYKRSEDALQDAKHLYKLRQGDYKVIQDGDYYIQVTRPIDETDPSITKTMIETDNETPKSLANTMLGWFRN